MWCLASFPPLLLAGELTTWPAPMSLDIVLGSTSTGA